MFISLMQAFGQTFIDSDQFLAVAGSVSSIFNAFGRIFWGQFADKASYKVRKLLMVHDIWLAGTSVMCVGGGVGGVRGRTSNIQ